ncbi:M81 family metallopeptidase [Seonamhaeicola aphaedonensis]|uniref:Microcystin degradation protein MlrC n=1 Tax=Seonamhaeicola aphaedonensis TaxID=1461338 RepID=A0A3D9HDA2_9FLAO|nr:M81 family metallopeptidase [Seonamhaeicola aphaedonensis]RED47448.1 microcystin degradation protein MlrC [Seonamhaeicola aphaedonensis]
MDLRNLILVLCSIILSVSCKKNEKSVNQLPRVAITGLAIESSTFSPATTSEDAFHAYYGEDVFKYFPFLNEPDDSLRKQAHYFPAVKGHAIPGGIVTKEAYDALMKKTLDSLRENIPYDGLFFDIHGAMSVEGLDDPEGDMIKQIRSVVGYDCVISTCMDLHGNVSEKLAKETDLITCYRLAPHEDAFESKERALVNLLDRLKSGKNKPKYKAWIPVPILLPGEKTSTRIEPGKSLYAQVAPQTKKLGVIDAAIWVGYAWADEPRNHAVVMVTGDDKDEVKASAEMLAQSFWDVRNEFEFVAPTLPFEEAIKTAMKSDKKPFMLSDMGDNPTAGGAGDVTWTLNELLAIEEFKNKDGKSLIYASIPGPKLIKEALKVGVGGKVKAYVGAEVDYRYAPPVLLEGEVTAIKKGDKNAEVEVVVKTGNISVIVTKKRKPYHYEKDFTDLNLNPRDTDVVVVKIGYLVPELYNMRGDWVMALTPGGVDQDLERLPYKRIKRPMFPLDKEIGNPDLSVRWIEKSGSKNNNL